jgi:hypothetical protein
MVRFASNLPTRERAQTKTPAAKLATGVFHDDPLRRHCVLRRAPLIEPVVVVTVTWTLTEPPWSSVITKVHVPAATAVTVNVVLGPVPEGGEIVAMPLHDGVPFDAVNVPL